MSELPDDVWHSIVETDVYSAAAGTCVCKDWHAVATRWLKANVPVEVRSLLVSRTCVKTHICVSLVLAPPCVSTFPHEVRRRYGGGECHVFDVGVVPAIMQSTGGVKGWAKRSMEKRDRIERRRRKEEEVNEEARRKVEAGLNVLGLSMKDVTFPPRSQSTEQTLRSIVHSHWLDSWTEGAYWREVQACVDDEGDHRGYYPGIYSAMSAMVRMSARFTLPRDGLPWLPKYETTEAAIKAALLAADTEEHERKARREELASKREKALEGREKEFVKARRGSKWTARPDQMRELAKRYSAEKEAGMRFFDCVLVSKASLRQACVLASRMEEIADREAGLSSGKWLFRTLVRSAKDLSSFDLDRLVNREAFLLS